MVVVATVDRVLLEVAQRVVHPAHVPLEAEAQAADVGRPRDARPRRRLLGGGDDPRLAAVGDLVELLEERRPPRGPRAHRTRWAPTGPPCASSRGRASRRRRRRGCRRCGTRAASTGRWRAGSCAPRRRPKLKISVPQSGCAPRRGSACSNSARAVEARERPLVAREVRRHPVEDHADAGLVQAVDEGAELVGRAEARRGREVRGHLVAPRAAERVGHDRHQLDVREADVGDVGGQLVGQLQVGQRAVVLQRVQPPGAEVDLVDRHRLAQRGRPAAQLHPAVVGPLVARAVDDRRRLGRQLGLERERVGAQQRGRRPGRAARTCSASPRRTPGTNSSQIPDAPSERIGCRRPSHELKSPTTDDRARRRAPTPRRPRPVTPSISRDMGAELLVELLVAALAGQVEVDLAQRGQEGVGVAQRVALAGRVLDLELVAQRQRRAGDLALEQPGRVALGQLDRLAALGARGDLARPPGGRRARRRRRRAGARRAAGAGRPGRDRRWPRCRSRRSQRLLEQAGDAGDRDARPSPAGC